jgi:hypothetical protein
MALEVVAEIMSSPGTTPFEALHAVAARRFGAAVASDVVEGWQEMSAAFARFPFHIGLVYNAPHHVGPANLLWEAPTGYRATMVGIPYDDLDRWRAVYPPEVFVRQFELVAAGFAAGAERLSVLAYRAEATAAQCLALRREADVAAAVAISYQSTANQAGFVLARNGLASTASPHEALTAIELLETTLRNEIALAQRLYEIQARDSRIGFEATNQYYYVPSDLAEKILNCRDLLDRWLPAERARHGT